jgi:hypothetical protein
MQATYSLATAIQFPSGLNATSRTGSDVLTSISSNLLFSREYLLTVPSSDPAMKKPSCVPDQHLLFAIAQNSTYARDNSRVVFLTVVHSYRLIVRSSTENAAEVVDSGSD